MKKEYHVEYLVKDLVSVFVEAETEEGAKELAEQSSLLSEIADLGIKPKFFNITEAKDDS